MGVASSKTGGNNGTGGSSRHTEPSVASADPADSTMPLKFVIPSVRAAGRDLQKRLLDEVHRLGYHSQAIFAINLALEEALANAINHGNRQDPKKHVRVWARIDADQAEIIVEDEGPGFDRGGVPDPTQHENLEKCSGRGILLIEAYMNTVEYSNGGRRLRMIKNNESDVLPRR